MGDVLAAQASGRAEDDVDEIVDDLVGPA